MNTDKSFSFFRAGLCLSSLFFAFAATADGKSIGQDNVNIREQPGMNSTVLFTVPLGYPIKIKKEEGNWIFFHDWQDQNGWVYKPLVSDIDTAVILVDKANIRSAATHRATVVANAKQGEIYTILSKKNNWVKLGYYYDGTAVGWIRDDLIFGE